MGMGAWYDPRDWNFDPTFSPYWSKVKPVLDVVGTALWYLPIGQSLEHSGQTAQGVLHGDWSALIPSPIKDIQKYKQKLENQKEAQKQLEAFLANPPQPEIIYEEAAPAAGKIDIKKPAMVLGGIGLLFLALPRLTK